MAFGASQSSMHTNRRKSCFGVFEIFIDAFFTIMAGATIGCILTEMDNHERSIQADMAVSAVAGFKNFVTIDVAGLADKGRAIRNFLM